MPTPINAFPFSGDVRQMINTWWELMSHPFWANGFVNVFNMNSAEPELEKRIVTDVGSYGRQLGRITDAVEVLTERLIKLDELSKDERAAIQAFEELALEIDRTKRLIQNPSAAGAVAQFLADLKFLSRHEPEEFQKAMAALREWLPSE